MRAAAIARALIYRAVDECERCPACASPRLSNLDLLPGRGRRLRFVSLCDECGLVFCNPPPARAELERFYSPQGPWEPVRTARPAGGAGPPKLDRSWRRRFQLIADALPITAPPAGATVLDFGCGEGRLLDALQAYGWETWGVEPALEDAFLRHRRLTAVPDEPVFDLIIAHHVLEHLADPLALLQHLARACRPGGYVFIGVPRFDTLPIHRDYKYVLNGRAHIAAFTWPCLQGLLARAGWTSLAAPPDPAQQPDEATLSRMHIVAQRRNVHPPLPLSPGEAARAAMRRYHRDTPNRPLLERLRLFRLAARAMEARWQRTKSLRKTMDAGGEAS